MISQAMTTGLLTADHTYTRKQLMVVFMKVVPTLTESSFQWTLGRMLKSGDIIKTGYDGYSLPGSEVHSFYTPLFSERAERVMKIVDDAYPYVSFTVFETVLMNEFLNRDQRDFGSSFGKQCSTSDHDRKDARGYVL